jgi:hypothetical protein
MSYDYALQQICPHTVIRESASFSDLTQTAVSFGQPPANQQAVVEIDGQVVPPSGLYSLASLPVMNVGPYSIKLGVNDLLFIQIGSNTPQFIQLLTGQSIKIADLVKDLSLKIPSLNISAINGRLVFSAQTLGQKFTFVDPRWSDKNSVLNSTRQVLAAFKTLGVNPGRVAIGKQLFPGWSIVNDPSFPDGIRKLVKFSAPIPNYTPVVHLSYVTTVTNCRRCFGTGIEFDYNILNNTYETIFDLDLLSQEFDKFVYTKIGSHWKWNWLGSGILDRIGGKSNVLSNTASSLITVDITTAFRSYQNIKQQQSQVPSQAVSDAEYPAQLLGVNVYLMPNDPTVALATTTVASRSQVPVQLKRFVGNPSPFVSGLQVNGVPYTLSG